MEDYGSISGSITLEKKQHKRNFTYRNIIKSQSHSLYSLSKWPCLASTVGWLWHLLLGWPPKSKVSRMDSHHLGVASRSIRRVDPCWRAGRLCALHHPAWEKIFCCNSLPEKKSTWCPPWKPLDNRLSPFYRQAVNAQNLLPRANVSCCWHIKGTKHSENVLQNLRKRNMNTPVASSKIELASQKRSPHGQFQWECGIIPVICQAHPVKFPTAPSLR